MSFGDFLLRKIDILYIELFTYFFLYTTIVFILIKKPQQQEETQFLLLLRETYPSLVMVFYKLNQSIINNKKYIVLFFKSIRIDSITDHYHSTLKGCSILEI